MPKQSQVVNANAVFPFDGYVVKCGDTVGGLVSVGACDGNANANLQYTRFKYQDSGAETLKEYVKNMILNIDFTLSELNPTKITQLGTGIFTQTSAAGTPVSGGSQVVASGGWEYNIPILLTGQNSTGAIPTINSVTGSVDGVIVLHTDYTPVKIGSRWYITIVDSTTVTTEAQTMTFDTDYTPSASETLDVGSSLVVLTPKIVQFEHTDASSNVRSLTVWSAAPGDGGFAFSFGSALDEGVNLMPISLEGNLDEDRTDGEQLFQYFDEQST